MKESLYEKKSKKAKNGGVTKGRRCSTKEGKVHAFLTTDFNSIVFPTNSLPRYTNTRTRWMRTVCAFVVGHQKNHLTYGPTYNYKATISSNNIEQKQIHTHTHTQNFPFSWRNLEAKPRLDRAVGR
jgi:hypothetical protein